MTIFQDNVYELFNNHWGNTAQLENIRLSANVKKQFNL